MTTDQTIAPEAGPSAVSMPQAAGEVAAPARVFTVLGFRYDFTQHLVVLAILRGGHSRAVMELSSGEADIGPRDHVSPYAQNVIARNAEHAKQIVRALCPTCGVADWEPHPRCPVMRCSNCKEHVDTVV